MEPRKARSLSTRTRVEPFLDFDRIRISGKNWPNWQFELGLQKEHGHSKCKYKFLHNN